MNSRINFLIKITDEISYKLVHLMFTFLILVDKVLESVHSVAEFLISNIELKESFVEFLIEDFFIAACCGIQIS